MRPCIRVALLVAHLAATDAVGQLDHFAAPSVGMTGTSVVTVAGPDAIFTNPARVGTGGHRGWLALGSASAFVGGPLLQFQHYNRAFTEGNVIDRQTAREIVTDWFGDPRLRTKRSAGIDASVTPAAVVVGIRGEPYGFAIRSRFLGSLGINGGWLDLMLVGTSESRSVPLDAETGLQILTDVGASTRRALRDDIFAGVTLRLVVGHEYTEGRLSSTAEITDRAMTHTFDYVAFAAGDLGRDMLSQFNVFDLGGGTFSNPRLTRPAGLGLGLDLGFEYHRSDRTRISFALTDLGSVRWTRNAVRKEPTRHTFVFEGLEFDLEKLREQFENDMGAYLESKLDSLAHAAYEGTADTYGSFSRALPAAASAAVAHRVLDGRGLLDVGTSVPLNRAIGQSSRDPRIHVGFTWRARRAPTLPIRGVLQAGGSGSIVLGAGIAFESDRVVASVGISGSPRSDFAGNGGRYAVAISAIQFRF